MSASTLPVVDYTSRDYEAIKASLIRFVQNQFPNDWNDFTESNLGMVILEMVAWMGDNLSFNLDQNAREVYIQTALQRPNVLRLARMLGYSPRTATAATVPIRCTIGAPQGSSTIIPAYTSFVDQGRTEYEFLEPVEILASILDTANQQVTNEVIGTGDGSSTTYALALANDKITVGSWFITWTAATVQYTAQVRNDGTIVLQGGGTGVADYDAGTITLTFASSHKPDLAAQITSTYQWSQRINAYEGRTRLDRFSSDATALQSFRLTRTPVLVDPIIRETAVIPDPSRFEVWIGDPDAPFGTGTGVKWDRIESIVLAGAQDEVYELVIDDADGVTVKFGDDVTGKIPPAGAENIHVVYRTGGGLVGNVSAGYIASNVVGAAGALSVTVAITNPEPGSGGAERETVEEIRVNAPSFARTNDTATTESDFDTIAGTYSVPGVGSIVRAKSRLTPPSSINAKIVVTDSLLTVVPVGTPTEYYLRIPASAPLLPATVTVKYTIATVLKTVTGNDLGSGVANLTGDASVDTTATRFRYDQLDYLNITPTGFSGNGTQIAFTLPAALKPPILPGSVVISYFVGGVEYISYDDGAGGVSSGLIGGGSIAYSTGNLTLNFGSSGERTSQNAATYNLAAIDAGNPVTLNITIDAGAPQALVLNPGDFANYAAATALEVVNRINAVITGAVASVSSNRVRIKSSTFGVTSIVNVTGGNANDATNGLNFVTGATTGTNYPPDNLTVIAIDYESCLRLVLNSAPDVGTDITMSLETAAATRLLPSNNIEVYTWSLDSEGTLTAPSSGLRDALKAYLDIRRVICTSVEVLAGFSVRVNVKFTATYDPTVAQVETNARIVEALDAYFDSLISVRAGEDIAIAALYQEVFPIVGITAIVIEEIGIRVPVGTGDGASAVFRSSTTSAPGQYISSGKLPMLAGAARILAYKGTTLAGQSDATTPQAVINAVGGLMLPNSFVHKDTGAFDLRFTPPPTLDQVVSVEFTLDETGAAGHAIWNVAIEPWEVAILGDIYVNSVKIN